MPYDTVPGVVPGLGSCLLDPLHPGPHAVPSGWHYACVNASSLAVGLMAALLHFPVSMTAPLLHIRYNSNQNMM